VTIRFEEEMKILSLGIFDMEQQLRRSLNFTVYLDDQDVYDSSQILSWNVSAKSRDTAILDFEFKYPQQLSMTSTDQLKLLVINNVYLMSTSGDYVIPGLED